MSFARPIQLIGAFTLAVLVATPLIAQQQKPSDVYARDKNRDRPNGGNRGQGNALDANTQVGSQGVNQSAQKVDYYARNLIVTHNVAGGRGFRGAVGYLAPSDFRGTTGGDSTKAFRAGSAFSDPTYFTAGFAQDRFNVAQGLAIYEYRRYDTPPSLTPEQDAVSGRIRLDKAGSNLALARQAQREAEPLAFGIGTDRTQRQVEFTASGVQGMRMRKVDDPIERSALPTFEKARARRDVTEGKLAPGEITTRFTSVLEEPKDTRLNTEVDAQIKPATSTDQPAAPPSAYDDIVRKIVARYGDRPDVHIDADPRAIEQARKDLAKLRGALSGPTPSKDAKSKRDDLNELDLRPKPAVPDAQPPETETPDQRADRERAERRQTIADAAKSLRHNTKIGDLSTGDRARIDELVRDGQKALADGEFFKAERAFDQALLLNADNPLLLAGLAHSQIGAGLYLSGALSLRTLFSQHPEMIDTRYEANLLPNETRLRLAVDTVRGRLTSKDADGYGLMLAYLGHQLGDRRAIEEGLRSLKGSMENDMLRELLSQVWLGKSATETDPKSESKPEAKLEEPVAVPPVK